MFAYFRRAEIVGQVEAVADVSTDQDRIRVDWDCSESGLSSMVSSLGRELGQVESTPARLNQS